MQTDHFIQIIKIDELTNELETSRLQTSVENADISFFFSIRI